MVAVWLFSVVLVIVLAFIAGVRVACILAVLVNAHARFRPECCELASRSLILTCGLHVVVMSIYVVE